MTEIWIALSIGLVVVLIIIVLNSKSKTFKGWNYFAGNSPELKALASEAKQNGATHFDVIGPSIGFYRERDGIVEHCFAEISMQSNRYEWVRPPTTGWQSTGDKMPDRALPLPTGI